MTSKPISIIVEYCGNKEAMKDFDFSESLDGMKGVIYESFRVINNRYPDLTFTSKLLDAGKFEVNISCDEKESDKLSLNDVINAIGFFGRV